MPLENIDDLFPPKPGELPATEDVTVGEKPLGLGLPKEIFGMKCPECATGTMQLRPSKFGYFYGCSEFPVCRASHGAKPDGSPLGTPGDKETKRARIFAHKVFDRLWKEEDGHKPLMNRAEAYAWMQDTLNLSRGEAHIGRFSKEQCNALVEAVRTKVPSVLNAWDKLMQDDDPF